MSMIESMVEHGGVAKSKAFLRATKAIVDGLDATNRQSFTASSV